MRAVDVVADRHQGPRDRIELFDAGLSLRGWLVVDSLRNGLCLGGLRLDPGVTPAVLEHLARLMTLKLAVAGVPLGGAKAGIVGTPGSAAAPHLIIRTAELMRPFLASCYLMGEDLGTVGSDVAAAYEHVGLDPLEVARNRMREVGVQLPLRGGTDLGGALGEGFGGALAGIGVAEAVSSAAETIGLELARARVAVQGFGTVGHAVARCLVEMGMRLVAVADVEGTIYSPGGLQFADLEQARGRHGVVDRGRLRQRFSALRAQDWYRVPAEVLVPAAIENALTASRLTGLTRQVRLVVEGANGPLSAEAEAALEARGVAVVPDIVANVGSAAAFGLLLTGQVTEVDQVLPEYRRRIATATRTVLGHRGGTARERAVSMATRSS